MTALAQGRALDLHVRVNELPLSSGSGQIQPRELGVGCEHCSVNIIARDLKMKQLQARKWTRGGCGAVSLHRVEQALLGSEHAVDDGAAGDGVEPHDVAAERPVKVE
jgi:hypothetical protein